MCSRRSGPSTHPSRRHASARQSCWTATAVLIVTRFVRHAAMWRSVDIGLGDAIGTLEEVEVATLVGLPRMLGEHLVIAARVVAWRRLVSLDALGDLGIVE